ncbi:MAG: hypothetical protein ACJ8AW_50510 [Rhodopila sp.]
MLRNPTLVRFSSTPRGMQTHADFMHAFGTPRTRTENWKALFRENAWNKDGSWSTSITIGNALYATWGVSGSAGVCGRVTSCQRRSLPRHRFSRGGRGDLRGRGEGSYGLRPDPDQAASPQRPGQAEGFVVSVAG